MKTNWQTKTLGEVCDVYTGSTPLRTKKDYWENGLVNWFTIKDIRKQGRKIKYTDQKITNKALKENSLTLLPKKSVLICCTASVGEWAMSEIELTTNQQFNGMVIKKDALLIPEYLFYYSSTLKEKLLYLSGKTTIDFVSLSKLKEIQIPLPPLPTQKAIVKILDEVFESISKSKENAEKNLKNAKELFESYLEEIFSNPKEDWEEKKLGEVCEIERGGSPRPIKSFLTKSQEGINWIKIGDTKNIDKYIYETQEKIKPEGIRRSRLVEEGDFILSNSMSFGRPYIMKTRGCIHDGWLVLRYNKELLQQDFLYYLLGSKFMYKQFDLSAVGSTVRNLNIDRVKKIIIPLPSIQEQEIIAEKLYYLSSEIKQLEEIYNQKIKDLEELKKSMLQKAFSGELTKE